MDELEVLVKLKDFLVVPGQLIVMVFNKCDSFTELIVGVMESCLDVLIFQF